MNKDKLNRKLEEQTARDHTNMRHWFERRHRRFERVMDEPILPSFCTISFYCMLIATVASAFTDIVAHLSYLSHLGPLHMIQNVISSAFFSWMTFAAIVIPCTIVQLKRGFDHPYFERFLLTKRGKKRMPIEKRFRLYLQISIVGLIVFGAAYIILRCAI